MTVIEILNKVLVRLREPTVTSLSETDYATMATDFIVDIHKELLDYDWASMQHTINVPVDASQRVLDLSRLEADGGDIAAGGRECTIDSLPLWAKWFDSSSSALGYPLGIVLPEAAEDEYYSDTSVSSSSLEDIAITASPDRDGISGILCPPCTSAKHIRMRFWTPEDEIDPDVDANRTLLVPWRPIYLGAVYMLLNERGEEIGEPGGLAERRYLNSVAQAKESDQRRKDMAGQYQASRE